MIKPFWTERSSNPPPPPPPPFQYSSYAFNMLAKDKGSLTTWNDKGKINVSSEGPSSGVSSDSRRVSTNSRRRAFARNVDFSFIVSGSERTFTFRVSLNTLPTLATLVRDFNMLPYVFVYPNTPHIFYSHPNTLRMFLFRSMTSRPIID